MILERLEKYKEALDVVRGKLGGNLFFNKSKLCGKYNNSPSLQTCPLLPKEMKKFRKPDLTSVLASV